MWEQRQRLSSCAELPRSTPPPGLVAEAKFSTATRAPRQRPAACKVRAPGDGDRRGGRKPVKRRLRHAQRPRRIQHGPRNGALHGALQRGVGGVPLPRILKYFDVLLYALLIPHASFPSFGRTGIRRVFYSIPDFPAAVKRAGGCKKGDGPGGAAPAARRSFPARGLRLFSLNYSSNFFICRFTIPLRRGSRGPST